MGQIASREVLSRLAICSEAMMYFMAAAPIFRWLSGRQVVLLPHSQINVKFMQTVFRGKGLKRRVRG